MRNISSSCFIYITNYLIPLIKFRTYRPIYLFTFYDEKTILKTVVIE